MSTTPLPELGQRAKAAARLLATLPTSVKDEALVLAADRLVEGRDEILTRERHRRRPLARDGCDGDCGRSTAPQ